VTIYYVDPSASTNGTGTQANPYNTLTTLSTATGDTVLLKSGTRLREGVPRPIFYPGSVTLAAYGTGAAPILDGSIDVVDTAWTYDATNAVYSYTVGTDTGGHVTEYGKVLNFVEWKGTVATTAAAMYNGTASWDYTNFKIYVKPLGGVMAGKTLQVSVIKSALWVDVSGNNCTVQDLVAQEFSKDGFGNQYSHNVKFLRLAANRIGGWKDTGAGVYIGGGLGSGPSSRDFYVEDCTSSDIFDSPFSSQLYGGQTIAQTSTNHEYRRCKGYRFGYSGFEWGVLSKYQRLTGVYMYDCYLEDGASSACWHSYDRDHVTNLTAKGNGISSIGGMGTQGHLDRIYAHRVQMTRVNRGIRNSYSYGDVFLDTVTVSNAVESTIRIDQVGTPSSAESRVIYNSKCVFDMSAPHLPGTVSGSIIQGEGPSFGA
jgi:hypothetical protein